MLFHGCFALGKTHTMEGSNERAELRGIIPNSFAHIFGQIAKAEAHQKFLVRVSYFEIYMEQIRDLLTKKSERERAVVTSLEVKEDKEKGKRTCIGSIDSLIDWLIGPSCNWLIDWLIDSDVIQGSTWKVWRSKSFIPRTTWIKSCQWERRTAWREPQKWISTVPGHTPSSAWPLSGVSDSATDDSTSASENSI